MPSTMGLSAIRGPLPHLHFWVSHLLALALSRYKVFSLSVTQRVEVAFMAQKAEAMAEDVIIIAQGKSI